MYPMGSTEIAKMRAAELRRDGVAPRRDVARSGPGRARVALGRALVSIGARLAGASNEAAVLSWPRAER